MHFHLRSTAYPHFCNWQDAYYDGLISADQRFCEETQSIYDVVVPDSSKDVVIAVKKDKKQANYLIRR